MIGYFYINSLKLELNELTGDIQTRANIYIMYEDRQFIETDLVVDDKYARFEKVFEVAQKYFKGDLKLMVH